MAWNDSTTPYELSPGERHIRPNTVVVEPNGGTVQIQFRNSAGTWVTPDDTAYTIAATGPVRLNRSNTPAIRIIATGAARFEVTQ
ncbi:hypothetical protein [Roseobacter litoralis]|uniref:hypothetical protein n=1 Tax=Roseobacter litoralis TaxID=42443 RepID=UPI002492ACF4|nr:hypothetical protein [Roseobacter litoralis]